MWELSQKYAPRKNLRNEVAPSVSGVVSEVGKVVVGMEEVTRQLLIALLGSGHVLLEGVPGVAKTTLSKTFAHLLGCQYQRSAIHPRSLAFRRYRHIDSRPQDE